MECYTELLTLLNEVSFRNVDERLRSILKNYSDLHMTRNVKLNGEMVIRQGNEAKQFLGQSTNGLNQVHMISLCFFIILLDMFI